MLACQRAYSLLFAMRLCVNGYSSLWKVLIRATAGHQIANCSHWLRIARCDSVSPAIEDNRRRRSDLLFCSEGDAGLDQRCCARVSQASHKTSRVPDTRAQRKITPRLLAEHVLVRKYEIDRLLEPPGGVGALHGACGRVSFVVHR